jgi:GAF domain-containing protein
MRWGVFVTESKSKSGAGEHSEDSLAADFASLARVLESQNGVTRTLEVICHLAVVAISGAEHAAITVQRRGGAFDTPAANDDLPPIIDRIQYATAQGPCVDAIRTNEIQHVDNLATDPRWPDFRARVISETAVRSMLSYPLFLQEDVLGALNLYSTRAGAFTSELTSTLGASFAAHAAVAFRAANDHAQVENMTTALVNSRRIGAAIGIMMARYNLTENAAFEQLRITSQIGNRKLRDVADDVVQTGIAPDPPSRRTTPARSPGLAT